jgi:hypothetical protein
VRDGDDLLAEPIVRLKQPTAGTSLDAVQAVARRGLGDLAEDDQRIPVDELVERRGLTT